MNSIFCSAARFLLLVCFVLNGSDAKTQGKDTIFLKREIADTPYPFYHAIYIDSNYFLKGGKKLIDFTFNKIDSLRYVEDLQSLKVFNKNQHLPKSIPSKWIRLYRYKNEYFTYDPSEAGENYKFEVTDSTTTDYTMEGPAPSKITRLNLLAPGKLLIGRENNWKGRQVKINIIDAGKGIAVFTFGPSMFSKSGYKLLMVSVENTDRFRTIINYCATDKQQEFKFDTIDFKKLEH